MFSGLVAELRYFSRLLSYYLKGQYPSVLECYKRSGWYQSHIRGSIAEDEGIVLSAARGGRRLILPPSSTEGAHRSNVRGIYTLQITLHQLLPASRGSEEVVVSRRVTLWRPLGSISPSHMLCEWHQVTF